MFRTILMTIPALAFALPFVASQPTMARPLATPTPQAEWGDRDDGGDQQVQIEVCTETTIFVGEDDRAYSCETLSGPQCLASCTARAVAPLCNTEIAARSGDLASCQEMRVESCRSQCEGAGARFCSPDLEARGLLDDDDDNDWKDDDDDGGDSETIVFIETETCFELDLEN